MTVIRSGSPGPAPQKMIGLALLWGETEETDDSMMIGFLKWCLLRAVAGDDPHRVGRFESITVRHGLGLIDLELEHVDGKSQVRQGLSGGAEGVDQNGVDHDDAARFQAIGGDSQDIGQIFAAAADEDAIRIGKLGQTIGQARLDDGQVADGKTVLVFPDLGDAPSVLLDGVNASPADELSGFDGNRSAAGPQVPEDRAVEETQPREHDGAYLGLGDQTLFVDEHVLGHAREKGRALPAGRIGLEHHQVEIGKRGLARRRRGQMGDLLHGRAQLLQHPQIDIGEAIVHQLGRQPGRIMGRIGIDRHGFPVGKMSQQLAGVAAAVQADDAHVLPGLAQAGEGAGHGRDVGQHPDVGGSQAPGQKGADAEEEGISRGEHHDGVRSHLLRQEIAQPFQILVDDSFPAGQVREGRDQALATHEDVGIFDDANLSGGQVVGRNARADDGDRRSQRKLTFIIDGFVTSPISALRSFFVTAAYAKVRLLPQNSQALISGLLRIRRI
ncbi:hypothetical protein DESC_370214 [Desulfosarcina cetonica]|nr:hypothetical protein DESC_370214 [Desulfosarcina cetonica]